MKWVDQVSEDCDWKTHFTPDEIVGAIVRILENNPEVDFYWVSRENFF